MSAIWERDRLYDFLRPYVDWCTRKSFSKLEVEGKLPDDGRAVIIAPNHSNTLMDALVVLQCRREGTVFGARADIFRKTAAARALRFLKILPIARRRDGLQAVAKNLDIMPEIFDTLGHNVPFCAFPEGRHRPMYSLLPIRKGVVRVAVGSAAMQPTCIVPVGLDYSDFFHYRGRCRVRIGDPIDVNAYLEEHGDLLKTALYEGLSSKLTQNLSELFLCLPDNETYEQRLEEARPMEQPGWKNILLGVVTAPFFALSAALTLPMWGVAEYICRYRLSDKAFSNSVRYLLKLVGTPLMLLVWGVLGFVLLPWWAALIVMLYFLLSYSIFYDWLNLFRRRRSFCR